MVTLGPDYLTQNCLWLGNAILNSCEDSLSQKIEEKALSWKQCHRTGPVYFKIMIDLIQSSTPKNMRDLISKLSSMKVSDFEYENVSCASSMIKLAIEMFMNN